jgi:hypothetical protein
MRETPSAGSHHEERHTVFERGQPRKQFVRFLKGKRQDRVPGDFSDVDDAVSFLDRAGDAQKARDFDEHHALFEDPAPETSTFTNPVSFSRIMNTATCGFDVIRIESVNNGENMQGHDQKTSYSAWAVAFPSV